MPVTDTGYRSEFLSAAKLAAAGGVTAYVSAWLDREALAKDWHRAEFKWRQLELELLPPKRKPEQPRQRPAAARGRRAGQGTS